MAATLGLLTIHVILLCAKFEEAFEARKIFQHLQLPVIPRFHGKLFYHSVDFLDLNQHSFHLEIYSCTDRVGGNIASAVATSLLEHKSPDWLFMTGVCAGHPDKTTLGDLVIADRAVEFRAGKIVEGGQIQHGSEVPSINPYLRDPIKETAEQLKGQWSNLVPIARPVSQRYKQEMLLQILCLHRRDQEKLLPSTASHSAPGGFWGLSLQMIQEQLDPQTWEEGESTSLLNRLSQLEPPKVTYCEISYQYYLDDAQYNQVRSLLGRGNYPKKDPKEPRVTVGVMATDSAVRADMSAQNWTQVAAELAQRELVGLEMEASGLYEAVRLFNDRSSKRAQAILIKGVSDLASPDKDDQYHSYGKQISAAFVYQFLRSYGYVLADIKETAASPGSDDKKDIKIRLQEASISVSELETSLKQNLNDQILKSSAFEPDQLGQFNIKSNERSLNSTLLADPEAASLVIDPTGVITHQLPVRIEGDWHKLEVQQFGALLTGLPGLPDFEHCGRVISYTIMVVVKLQLEAENTDKSLNFALKIVEVSIKEINEFFSGLGAESQIGKLKALVSQIRAAVDQELLSEALKAVLLRPRQTEAKKN